MATCLLVLKRARHKLSLLRAVYKQFQKEHLYPTIILHDGGFIPTWAENCFHRWVPVSLLEQIKQVLQSRPVEIVFVGPVKGRLDEAEKYFTRALEEAKKGFGEEDPHVASSCNNLVTLLTVCCSSVFSRDF